MEIIPLEAVNNQKFSIVLGGQNCDITVYERNERVFVDLSVDGAVVRQGMLAVAGNILPRNTSAFFGALMFVDILDGYEVFPRYAEFDRRWQFVWLTEEEMGPLRRLRDEALEAQNG